MASSNKTALVTGSTSGVGLACAHALAKRGVDVVINGSRDESLVESTLADFKGYGVRVDYVRADLSKQADVQCLWSQVLQLHPDGIDILINNAAVMIVKPLDSLPDDEWDQTIALNLSAPFHLTKRSLPAMKKKGWGRIVNVSSVCGVVGYQNITAYSAAKHGLIGLTKSHTRVDPDVTEACRMFQRCVCGFAGRCAIGGEGVALENASHGITCNAVCPGALDTPTTHAATVILAQNAGLTLQQVQSAVVADNPTGTLIKPEQVAELVEFLRFSGASSQMTGASYFIDCTYTAK